MPTTIDNGSTAKIVLYVVLTSDHITAATGKTVAVTISKNGGAFGNPSGGATNATEIASGWYYFTPSATDTGTNGPLIVLGTATACDPSTRDFLIATALSIPTAAQNATAVWQDATAGDFTTSGSIGKSLFTSGAVPGAAGGLFIAGTNAATTITTSLTTHIVGTVDTVTTLTNLPTAPTDWLTAAAVKADAVTKIQTGLATPTNITAGTITTVTTLTNLPSIPTDWLSAAGVSAAAVTKIQSGLSTYAGGDTSGTTTLLARLTSTRAGLLDNLDASVAAVGTTILAAIPSAATNAAAVWDLATSGHTTADTFGAAVTTEGGGGLDAAGVRAAIGMASANLDTQLAAIPDTSAIAAAVLTTQMTESYNVDNAAPTLAQAQFVTMQRLTEFAISGTAITVRQLDGTTTAYTLTMDAAAGSATSSTRTS